MTEKPHKVPGPDHPITITVNPRRVVVTVGSATIACSDAALTLREATYPAVHYIPREDVDMGMMSRSTTTSYCPYKGDASYFSISASGDRSADAVWSYEEPHPAVAAIREYLAFYPDRVDRIEEVGADRSLPQEIVSPI